MENKSKKTAQRSNNFKSGRGRATSGGPASQAKKNTARRTTAKSNTTSAETHLVRSRDILSTPEIMSPFDESAKRKNQGTAKKNPVKNFSSAENIDKYYDEIIDAAVTDILSPALTGNPARKAALQKAAEHKAEKKKPAPEAKPTPKRQAAKKAADSVERAATVTPDTCRKLARVSGAKIKIIPLGGLNEVGKNMTAIEYGDDIIVIDCGIGFPSEDEMPGVDLMIPDISYLEANVSKVRGIVLTHGHEDHIGAIPYVLKTINPPIYGTRLTLGIIENKLSEHTLPSKPDMRCVKAGDTIRLGTSFAVEFIRVNHSIADACALAISTPLGLLLHTGDFKLDLTPIEGEMMDITRLGQLGKEGVLMLMCESTNAERPGYTPSEKKVGQSLEMIFTVNKDMRIVIATFSSNVHRVQQIIDISARHGRKVAVTGRSMLNIVRAATELGYMSIPDGVLIDISEIKRYKPSELTLVTTGSQGEPMSALYRMAFSEHNQVTLGQYDLVVLSASAIPGNEKLVNRIVNELKKNGVKVINDAAVEVHVSGHACQEELKLMIGLTKPKYFLPIHGEYKHLAANRDLAVSMGVEERNAFITEIGKIVEIDEKGARFGGTVQSGVVLIDGYGVGDVGNIVLRDRKHLSQDGLIIVVAVVSEHSALILSGPDIVSRGFVYVRESEELMDEVRMVAADSLSSALDRSGADWYEVKNKVRDDITKFIYSKTKRKPMILPIIMEV